MIPQDKNILKEKKNGKSWGSDILASTGEKVAVKDADCEG